MSAIIDLLKIIELKNVLKEHFSVDLHVHDTCGGQFFSVEKVAPDAILYIREYFEKYNYDVIFTNDNSEFYLEETRLC